MAKVNMEKVKAFAGDIRQHWSKPAEGRYVPYREYKDIFIAVGSNYAGSKCWNTCGSARAAT
jgi:hypothetical protein